MSAQTNRRRFLQTATVGGAALGFGDLGFLNALPPVSAADAQLDSKLVRLESGIEPLVQLLELVVGEASVGCWSLIHRIF